MKPDVRTILSSHNLRITVPRLAVFSALESTTAPVSVTDIIKACPGVDKVSVYRSVDLLVKLGIAITVPHGWKQRYELAAPFRPHHHHAHCTKCGNVAEIHSPELEQFIAVVASKQGFYASSHTFEISGLCAACQQTTRPAV